MYTAQYAMLCVCVYARLSMNYDRVRKCAPGRSVLTCTLHNNTHTHMTRSRRETARKTCVAFLSHSTFTFILMSLQVKVHVFVCGCVFLGGVRLYMNFIYFVFIHNTRVWAAVEAQSRRHDRTYSACRTPRAIYPQRSARSHTVIVGGLAEWKWSE